MTDTPLLRLARALLDGAEGHATFDETTDRMRSLVRDLEAAPPPVDDRASRRAADLLISHFGGQSLEDAVEKAVAVRYMKREEGIIPPWEMLVPPAPARRTITREEFNAARVLFLDEDMTSSEVMTAVAAAWRLTVED